MSSTKQDTPYDPDNPKEIEEYNNRKLTADKIRQILINVKNNPGDSSRRWIWELVQNAKDVPNRFKQVSIAVTLYPDRLVFEHNGDPFRLTNLMSLVQQVSSKDSQNSDEEVTGKFGTGFISTHLLSDVITVKGVLEHRKHYKDFTLTLDRKGESSEDLLPKITAALERLNNIDSSNEFPIFPDTRFLEQEEILSTKFTYVFDHEENKTAAVKGLEDLVNTLPATLVNLGKVRKVAVRNLITQSRVVYENTSSKDEFVELTQGIINSEISITEGENQNVSLPSLKSFVSHKDGKDLFLNIEIDEERNALIPPVKGSPRLYRDFPLIGSHKFYFPFIINGTKFNPTERRDGLILHAKNDSGAAQNREILSRSFLAAQAFTKKLIASEVSNRYLLAFTRIPDAKWTEEFSLEWITNHQRNLRSFLISQPLVETSASDVCGTLESCYIPNYSERKETRLAFYDLVEPFLGKERVPKKDLLLNWIEAVGPKDEIDSWSVKLYYDLKDLIEHIEKCLTLTKLQEELGSTDAIRWLQQLYDFIYQHKESDYLTSNAIVPNHYGDFKKTGNNELKKEDKSDPFDNHFLKLLKTVSGSDWKSNHIHPSINTTNIACESSTLKELSDQLTDVIGKRINTPDGNDYAFLSRQGSLEILIDLLRLREQTTQPDNFRFRLLDHARKLLKFEDQPLTVGNIRSVNFEPATKLFIRKINKRIEKAINLSGLSEALGLDDKQTIDWLNDYLHLVYDNSTYTEEIKYGRIIPDQYDDFHRFESLKDPGTVDVPIPDELIKALYDLDNSQDLKGELISRKVTICKNDAYSFSELGTAIQACIAEIQAEDAREAGELMAHKDAILDIIDWCGDNPDDASIYLKGFNQDQSSIFYKLTLGDSNIKVRDIKLLEKPENISILRLVNDSGISVAKMTDLITNIDPASVDEVIKHAKAVHEEAVHMKRMLKIGKDVEKEILAALRLYIPEATISDPTRGRGSFDIRIKNPRNGEHYDLEVKSYAPGRGKHFLFAPSQARRALKIQPNFAICLLQTPTDKQMITAKYVNDNLRVCHKKANAFHQGYMDYQSHDEITNRPGISQLFINVLGAPRVKVDGAHLKANTSNFATLINDIRKQIQ